MTTTTKNLKQILEQLTSDEARARVISGLVSKGIILPKDYLDNVIDLYEKAGKVEDAATVAQKAGLTKRAIDLYEKAERFDVAAGLAKEAGLTERANKLYLKAIADYEKAGRFDVAAGLAKEAGLTERVKLYKTLEQLLK